MNKIEKKKILKVDLILGASSRNSGLDQRFSTQITPGTILPTTYNFWTVDGKTQSLEPNFTPLLHLSFKKEI
jgi:hypothetical protein